MLLHRCFEEAAIRRHPLPRPNPTPPLLPLPSENRAPHRHSSQDLRRSDASLRCSLAVCSLLTARNCLSSRFHSCWPPGPRGTMTVAAAIVVAVPVFELARNYPSRSTGTPPQTMVCPPEAAGVPPRLPPKDDCSTNRSHPCIH